MTHPLVNEAYEAFKEEERGWAAGGWTLHSTHYFLGGRSGLSLWTKGGPMDGQVRVMLWQWRGEEFDWRMLAGAPIHWFEEPQPGQERSGE